MYLTELPVSVYAFKDVMANMAKVKSFALIEIRGHYDQCVVFFVS